MMGDGEILEKLQDVFDKVFMDPVKISRELSAKDVEDWDSLSHISLLVSVEKAFGIRFSVGEVEKAQNVGQFIDLIKLRLSQK